MRKLFVLVACVALCSAGCGSGSKSPTAPSSSAGTPSSGSPVAPASATINGLVQSGGAAASGMIVAVVNTALSTKSDSGGRFSLTNVPAGDVQLHITGSGADAVVPVGTVAASQTMNIVVSVSGSSGKVEDPGQNQAESRVEGAIQSISAPDFTVNGQKVHTDASTKFENGSLTITFSSLKVGTDVEVKGTLSGTTLNAASVELQPAEAPEPPEPPENENEVELKGLVSNLKGTASSFTFDLGSQHVKGDSSTRFDMSGGSDGGSNSSGPGSGNASFTDLKNGETVEVHGTTGASTITATRIHIENENEDNDQNEAELKGALGTVTGSCPSISSSVGTTKFTTSSSTKFDEVSCSALKSGDMVEVKGTKGSNGIVAATEIKREDN
jgi:Domain of unknown function (DUF5666)